jgi:hypothetical protein
MISFILYREANDQDMNQNTDFMKVKIAKKSLFKHVISLFDRDKFDNDVFYKTIAIILKDAKHSDLTENLIYEFFYNVRNKKIKDPRQILTYWKKWKLFRTLDF